jgi:hypothetical protein
VVIIKEIRWSMTSPDTSRRVKMSFIVKCQTHFFSPLAFNEPEIL